jgi:hypothetical protein
VAALYKNYDLINEIFDSEKGLNDALLIKDCVNNEINKFL